MKVPHELGHRSLLPGLVLQEHRFHVPLDHANPSAETICVFAREVRSQRADTDELPWLVYLQGGPGYESPRPMDASGWLGRALENHNVLLLDQRGTGRSSALDPRTLEGFEGTEAAARWLSHFRADSIVEDCELIRRTLLGDRRWRILGQSFGGFCSMRYLSAHPEGLEAALITGGIPSLTATATEVYEHTYPLLAAKHGHWFKRYPEDEQRLADLYALLAREDVRLTDGDRLTPERFSMVGLQLGMSDGYEVIHYLLEQSLEEAGGPQGRGFQRAYERTVLHDHHPIFSILHEACYTQGAASGWAAARQAGALTGYPGGPGPLSRLNGEMIHPWMFEQIGSLAPWRDAAELLAHKADWPTLYDPERLAKNEVPTAAAVYSEDMYVPRALSMETAAAIPHLEVWESAEHEHNGLRVDGRAILDRLLSMVEEMPSRS